MSSWSKKRGIMRRYNVTASIYDVRYAEEQQAKFVASFKHIGVNNLGMVLDVGCGTGLLFDHVADRAEAVVGVDISRETLHFAKEGSKGFSVVHLVLADADNLPFVGGVFSHVFAFTLVQNTPNPRVTIAEIERVAESDATIVVSGLKKAFSRENFEKLLSNAGLVVNALEEDGDLKCYVAVCAKRV